MTAERMVGPPCETAWAGFEWNVRLSPQRKHGDVLKSLFPAAGSCRLPQWWLPLCRNSIVRAGEPPVGRGSSFFAGRVPQASGLPLPFHRRRVLSCEERPPRRCARKARRRVSSYEERPCVLIVIFIFFSFLGGPPLWRSGGETACATKEPLALRGRGARGALWGRPGS